MQNPFIWASRALTYGLGGKVLALVGWIIVVLATLTFAAPANAASRSEPSLRATMPVPGLTGPMPSPATARARPIAFTAPDNGHRHLAAWHVPWDATIQGIAAWRLGQEDPGGWILTRRELA